MDFFHELINASGEVFKHDEVVLPNSLHVLFNHAVRTCHPNKFIHRQCLVSQVLSQASLSQVADEIQLPQPVHRLNEAQTEVGSLPRLRFNYLHTLIHGVDLNPFLRVVHSFAVFFDAQEHSAVGHESFVPEGRPVVELSQERIAEVKCHQHGNPKAS